MRAVGRGIYSISEDALNEMTDLLESACQNALLFKFDAHIETDTELHRLITRSIDNNLFLQIWRRIEDRNIRIRCLVETICEPQEVVRIVDEHLVILEALQPRNCELAHDLLAKYLKSGAKKTSKVF